MSAENRPGDTLSQRFKPATSKRTLLFLGGSFWAAAGLMLVLRGIGFFTVPASRTPLFLAIATVGGFLFYKLVFERVSFRYIGRILALQTEKPCLFSFLSVRGYLTMAFMIALGIGLRLSGLLPADDLGALYLSIGVPLAASSFHFFRQGMLLL